MSQAQLNWKKPAGLAAVLVVVSSLAYWLEYSQKPKKEAAEEESKKVFRLKKGDSVEMIRIAAGDKSVTMRCLDLAQKMCKPGDNSRWEVDEPTHVRADDGNVNSLVSTLNNLNATDVIDLKLETPEKRQALLKEYGLDPEALKANGKSITIKAGAETKVQLGGTHPIGEGIFALSSAVPDTVFVLPSYVKSNFEHDLTYWRDKKILPLAQQEVGSFVLEDSKGGARGERASGQQWIVHPLKGNEDMPGDVENIESFLSGAAGLQATSFASSSKSDAKAKSTLAGAKPILTLTLQKSKTSDEKSAPQPVILKLFAKFDPTKKTAHGATPTASRVFATVSTADPLYEVDVYAKDRLDKSLKDLRLQKLITSVERFTAKKIEFSGKPLGAQPITLTNADSQWKLSDNSEADPSKVQNLLERISGNRIQDFVSDKAMPPGQEDGVIFSLFTENSNPKEAGQPKRKYVFWKKDKDLFARDLLSPRNEALRIDPALSEALPWEPGYFKKAAKK